jgi:RHS repeat-associated protein
LCCTRGRGRGGKNIFEQINNTTGTVTYLHHDQQGSTRLLTSSAGAKEATYTYSPYGELTGSTGTATTSLGFDGQYTSSDTGLIYLRARVYDPKTAQFLSVDPLASLTREPYVYAGDNPLTYKDRSGLGIEEIFEGPSIPCPWCAAQEGIQEVMEGAYHEVQHGIEWVNNHVGTEELDEPANQGAAAGEEGCGNTPPGYNPDTWTRGPASRPSDPGENFFDPEGGEWRWHAPDKYHPEGHWDYKGPGKFAPWENIYP